MGQRKKKQKRRAGSTSHGTSDRAYWASIKNGQHTVPEFHIADGVLGRVTVEALLRSEGTIEFVYQPFMMMVDRYAFFHIAHNDFWFTAGVIRGELVFQRCEYILRVPLSLLAQPFNRGGHFLISWSMDHLLVTPGTLPENGVFPQLVVTIQPRPTPHHLLDSARKQNLAPTAEYNSAEELLARVHSGLSFLQDKIDEIPNVDLFWNLVYQGNTIVARNPKKEKEILPAIQCLLSDFSLTSSIQVIPEMTTSTGRLDFLFVGQVRGQGSHQVCAEFKSAHSADLINGIEVQLPAYMNSLRAMDGTYCILDFRGEHFDEPRVDTAELHRQLAIAAERGWPHRYRPIKLHHFHLGRPKR
jgi:hypothetical protein